MGMSIDEVLKIIKDGRIIPYIIRGNNEDDTEFNKANIEALHVIVNIMCKYQKIEQILKDIPYGGEATVRRIQEVVEDGM